MPERDGYIPGVPCWIDTSQPDPEAGVAFYRDLVGLPVQETFRANYATDGVIFGLPATSVTLVTWFPTMPAGSVKGTVLETGDLDGDVAALATKWDTPLSARLQPVAGKKAGEQTAFDDPYLFNTIIHPAP